MNYCGSAKTHEHFACRAREPAFEISFTRQGRAAFHPVLSSVNLRRCIIAFYLVLIGGIGVAAAVFFVDARQEYARLTSIQAESRRQVAEAELRLKYQEKVLERLSSDPSYVEKVIRRKLGYARPDEFVFRFEN
jgi:cell division protein FtsB